MKKTLIILLLILSTGISHSANWYNNQYRRLPNKVTRAYSRPLPLDNLNALEKYSLNRVYRNDNPVSRLERLETEAFGAVQHGNLISRYENVESALLSRPKSFYSPKRSLMNNLATFLAGQATGYTPPIINYPQINNHPYGYNTIYPTQGNGMENINEYSNGLFNRGYSINNHNVGNGTKVTILD